MLGEIDRPCMWSKKCSFCDKPALMLIVDAFVCEDHLPRPPKAKMVVETTDGGAQNGDTNGNG